MNPVDVNTGILNIKFFVEELTRLYHNKVGGLRAVTNNKGVVVGKTIRWPLVDTDGIASPTNFGSPTIPDSLVADTVEADIVPYEGAVSLDPFILASTNSAAGLRAAAAEKVMNKIENRFTDVILTALAQYDDTNMELGSSSDSFDVDFMTDLDTMARVNNWPDGNRFLLLPPQAENSLKKDQKFYEVWSLYQGRALANPGAPTPETNSLIWYPWRGWNIAFMGQKGADNTTGLPATNGSNEAVGYAWVRDRVGFGMNQNIEGDVFIDKTKQGNPIVFKANGSCGATIIDKKGVIGIIMSGTLPF